MDCGATIEAVELCLASNAPGCAADLVAQSGTDLIDQGFGETVKAWSDRLGTGGAAGRPERLRQRLFPAVRPWTRLFTRTPSAPPPSARVQPRTAAPPVVETTVAATAPTTVVAASGLAVRLLGELTADIDGVAVTRWSGNRGRSVLRYLVTYRHHVIPRDVLVDVFWPDAAPDLGRNRLHVTLHALRADLPRQRNGP